MGEVTFGKRQGGFHAHEGKSLCILRLCIVWWKDARFPESNDEWKPIHVVSEHTARHILGWSRWGISTVRVEKYSQDTTHCRSSERSKSGWEKWSVVETESSNQRNIVDQSWYRALMFSLFFKTHESPTLVKAENTRGSNAPKLEPRQTVLHHQRKNTRTRAIIQTWGSDTERRDDTYSFIEERGDHGFGGTL